MYDKNRLRFNSCFIHWVILYYRIVLDCKQPWSMRLLTIASAWPVVAASRRLRAAHREKHWRYKAYSEAKSELILRLEYSWSYFVEFP